VFTLALDACVLRVIAEAAATAARAVLTVGTANVVASVGG
jgi:hypothetical protein